MNHSTVERGFTLTRTVDAPPAQVFRAWTDPAYMNWYFNPEQPTPDDPIEVDLRVGGTFRLMMFINDDLRYWTGGLYLEIDEPRKLVFAMGAYGGWPELDADNPDATPVVTLDFQAAGSQTLMILAVSFPGSMSEADVADWIDSGMRPGWSDTIDRVVEMFANMAA
jgi:uncharacterized protein YndB with AHSA1/START domain